MPRSALIRNGVTRLAMDGSPLNAHQGSMLLASDGRFYLYGNYHRACGNAPDCHCSDHRPGCALSSSRVTGGDTGFGSIKYALSAPATRTPTHRS